MQRWLLDATAVSLGCACSLRPATERLSRARPTQSLYRFQSAVLLAGVTAA